MAVRNENAKQQILTPPPPLSSFLFLFFYFSLSLPLSLAPSFALSLTLSLAPSFALTLTRTLSLTLIDEPIVLARVAVAPGTAFARLFLLAEGAGALLRTGRGVAPVVILLVATTDPPSHRLLLVAFPVEQLGVSGIAVAARREENV